MILFASRPVRACSRGWFGLVVLIAFGPDSGHLAAHSFGDRDHHADADADRRRLRKSSARRHPYLTFQHA